VTLVKPGTFLAGKENKKKEEQRWNSTDRKLLQIKVMYIGSRRSGNERKKRK